MLSNVTWGEYLVTLIVLIVLYYGYLGYRYYREEIKSFLSGKFSKVKSPKDPPPSGNREQNNDELFDELETVVNDLRYGVLDKAGKKISKSELLDQLKDRLRQYSGLQRPAYRTAINNYIIMHAKEICGIDFIEQELNTAWDGLSR
jgi:hypothetical protein